MKGKTFIVIPACNEEKHISEIAKQAKKFGKVVVVDDGSTDSTFSAASGSGAVVLKHMVNLGKGAALRTGCDYALDKGADIIVVMDGDGQHDPDDIPKMIGGLDGADIVFSYRHSRNKMPFLRRMGNLLINLMINSFFRINVLDTQSGFRAFKRNTYRRIRWIASDYSVESEMVAKTGKYKLRFNQLPIETIYSDAYKGVTVLTGLKIVLYVLWWRLTK